MATPRNINPEQIKRAHASRRAWEGSREGRSRLQGIQPLGSETHADAYKRLGYEDDSIHPMGQMELPGMEHPDVVPQKRWEDHTPQERKRIERQAARFGVTRQSAGRAFGAQLDQSYERAGRHNAEPHAMRFYSGGKVGNSEDEHTPRSRMVESAKQNGVSMSQQVVANAITSPKQVFSRVPESGKNKGKTIYPNDMLANEAIQHAQLGLPHETARAPKGVGGMHNRVQAAAYAHEQSMKGVPNPELTHPKGTPVFGPKTGPYHNTWVDPHGSSQFLVSDIHTGGGGMAPHLSNRSPVLKDEAGNDRRYTTARGENGSAEVQRRGASPREQYLRIKGIHAFHDHVARQELQKRGLQSISGGQAAQWGEERLRRGLQTETEAFPKPKAPPRDPNQLRFDLGDDYSVAKSTNIAAPKSTISDANHDDDDPWAPRNQARNLGNQFRA